MKWSWRYGNFCVVCNDFLRLPVEFVQWEVPGFICGLRFHVCVFLWVFRVKWNFMHNNYFVVFDYLRFFQCLRNCRWVRWGSLDEGNVSGLTGFTLINRNELIFLNSLNLFTWLCENIFFTGVCTFVEFFWTHSDFFEILKTVKNSFWARTLDLLTYSLFSFLYRLSSIVMKSLIIDNSL